MNEATQDYIRPGYETQPIPGFPHAPLDWSREDAEGVARSEGMTLTDEHWQVCVRCRISVHAMKNPR